MEKDENLSNELNNEKKIKTRKIGRFTFGLILILTGVLVFVQTVTTIDTLRYIMMLSPLVFISLGLEILFFSRKNDIKYDFVGVILTFLTLGAGWIFAGINYGVNKVLYSDEFVNALSQRELENENTYYFDEFVDISNLADRKIDLKIVEKNNVENTIVYVKYNLKNQVQNNNVIEYLINNGNCYNNVSKSVDYENNSLVFFDVDEEIENMEIKIITNNKENIKYGENFNII